MLTSLSTIIERWNETCLNQESNGQVRFFFVVVFFFLLLLFFFFFFFFFLNLVLYFFKILLKICLIRIIYRSAIAGFKRLHRKNRKSYMYYNMTLKIIKMLKCSNTSNTERSYYYAILQNLRLLTVKSSHVPMCLFYFFTTK